MNILTASTLYHAYPKSGLLFEKNGDDILSDISLTLSLGQTVALLGPSGCGKSTLARLLVGLEKPRHGTVYYRNQPLSSLSRATLKSFRQEVQMVFQDSISALNPRKTVQSILLEPLKNLLDLSKTEQLNRIAQVLNEVELDISYLTKLPTQLSGGQLQRLSLARALVLKPKLLILDEAVSNIDLVIQAGIIKLLQKLGQQKQMACLFITHDLRLAQQLCQQVIVMEKGRIVETAKVDKIICFNSVAGQQLQKAVLPPFPVRKN